MRLRKNIIVLDTETTGDFKQPLVHDIGYVIIDKDFHILKTVRYLVKNVRDCLWALNYSEFYRSKSMLYDLEIENGNVNATHTKDSFINGVGKNGDQLISLLEINAIVDEKDNT